MLFSFSFYARNISFFSHMQTHASKENLFCNLTLTKFVLCQINSSCQNKKCKKLTKECYEFS